MSNPGKPQVVTTRWWWIRHAPVREDNGCIYGQEDLGCDTSDRVVFEAVGKILPRNAVWTRNQSTHQPLTRSGPRAFRGHQTCRMCTFAEQHLGQWQ